MAQVLRDEYNRHMRTEFEQVRDFIILHYFANQNDSGPFWTYCRTMEIPESLQRKIELFREAGRIFRYEEELFTRPSWVAVLLGQQVIPRSYDPVVLTLPHEEVAGSLESMRAAMAGAAARMPTHEEFLARYCPSESA